MSVLDEVTKLANQGKTEPEIISELQQRGIPPKQINDAIEQYKIKAAIAPPNPNTSETTPQQNPLQTSPSEIQQQDPPTPTSVYAQEQTPYTQQYQTQQNYPQQQAYSDQQYQQQNYNDYSQEQGQGYYGYQDYQGYDSAAYGGSYEPTSMVEIAEQVFSEQIKKFQKDLSDLKEFKAIAASKIENISERLKKIENTIDKLQITILEKIGSYGENLEFIKKEISMVEDSFKKMTGKVADKISKKSRK